LELIVGAVCLSGRLCVLSQTLVAWLATCLLSYRIGLWSIGWTRPCHCLGNFTDAIHISPAVADAVMKGILAYLIIGSYFILFWSWKKRETVLQGVGAGKSNLSIS